MAPGSNRERPRSACHGTSQSSRIGCGHIDQACWKSIQACHKRRDVKQDTIGEALSRAAARLPSTTPIFEQIDCKAVQPLQGFSTFSGQPMRQAVRVVTKDRDALSALYNKGRRSKQIGLQGSESIGGNRAGYAGRKISRRA
jgi:hypothetical protein